MKQKIWKLLSLCIAGACIISHPIISSAETIKVEGGSVTYETNESGTTDITFSKDGGWTNEGQELEFKYSDGSDFILDDYVRQDNGDITVTTVGDFDINQLEVKFSGDPPATASTEIVSQDTDNAAPQTEPASQDTNDATPQTEPASQAANDTVPPAETSGQTTNDVVTPAQHNSKSTANSSGSNTSAMFTAQPNTDYQGSADSNDNGGAKDDSSAASSNASPGAQSNAHSDAFSPAGMTYEALNSDARRGLESEMSYSTFTSMCEKAINAVGANQTLTINTGKWMSLDRKIMEAIAARPDMAVTINYIYNEKAYSVTIPAGYNVMSLLDENGYCGFLYLNAVFGANAR